MIQVLDVEIVVTRIRHRGELGGVIIYGHTDDGEKYAARLNWRHVPDATFVDTGQRWRVRGPFGIVTRARYNGIGTDNDIQIEADQADLIRPAGKNLRDWISKSQYCRGIGPAKAGALYAALGPDLVDHIEQRRLPELIKAGKLTEDQAESLCDAFMRFNIGSTLLWLDRLRIPRTIGNKLVRYYGNETASEIEADPYALVSFEADWRKVDELARTRFGVALDDPRRLQSAMEECLYRAQDLGHTCLPVSKVNTALWPLLKNTKLIHQAIEASNLDTASCRTVGGFLQSGGMHVVEGFLAKRFGALIHGANERGQASLFGVSAWNPARAADVVREYEVAQRINLNKEQRAAIEMASREYLSLIIGPAGTGKTTVLNALRQVILELNPGVAIYQMAPTGLAAQRMTLATVAEATTIHSFLHNVKTEDIAIGSVIVIDEASMLDVLLAYRLFRHLPEGVRVIIVGDPGQLPPVGPGLVLHTLVESPLVPQVRLTKVLRQQESTGIPVVANQIREGVVPSLPAYAGMGSGVTFLECPDHSLDDRILALHDELQGGSNYDVQVLSPVRRGTGSVKAINAAMHEAYRKNDTPATLIDPAYGTVWVQTRAKLPLKERDKVMFTRNDYDLGLRNGSLGVIEKAMQSATVGTTVLRAVFEGVRVELTEEDIENLTHSYGITIHKSQGSQFKKVIVVLKKSRVLTREALYTALTRGVDQVVLVGSREVLKEAILTAPSTTSRHTLLWTLMMHI